WSIPILLGYIHEVYLKLQNKETVVPSIDRSYEDVQKYLQGHQNDNKDYWDKYVSQIEDKSDLSGLSSSSRYKSLKTSEFKHITNLEAQTLIIEENLYYSLKNICQEEGVTLNAILQYTWHKVLNIYGNSEQTVVGTIVSGRNLPIDYVENSVGLYINTLPLLVDHRKQKTKSIIESIRDIQNDISEISSRSNISLANLQKGREHLFDNLFMFENYPNPSNEEHKNRIKLTFKQTIEKSDYPLGITAYEEDNQLIFALRYAEELFNKDNIEYLLLITRELLEQIAINPNQKVQSLNYLNSEQYKEIIYTWNDTDKDYPRGKTIQALFEDQVERTPDSIAVTFEENKLTYQELNERANKLGHYLRKLGVRADTLVAIAVERSIEMIIGLLGILKAGGAYVPLDSSYPTEHLQFILKDTQAPIILTDKNTNDKIPMSILFHRHFHSI
ncbi:MAG: gramicidin biosynthesis protein, partial [Alphaproteobacteria bacterium]|nr:gramicidin biosynthesis protein [Alphaproteobacteria bacterium]